MLLAANPHKTVGSYPFSCTQLTIKPPFNTFFIRCVMGSILLLSPIKSLYAEPAKAALITKEVNLPEIVVKEKRIQDTRINRTQSSTTITAKDLERTQAATIFDAIKDVPGVAIQGGPRPSGMSFNIRGYTDNEDVAVKVDGVSKGFEKYRMGGTFIEPELLKSIEVQRGPQISSGSGSLGGTIIASTKNAADLLAPGQQYGARAKFGYANNNDEYSRSYMVYARPHALIDILYNYSNRQSGNITLADDTKLESSAIESVSQLLKVSIFPMDDIELTTSIVSFKDSGLQPYDVTGGQPGTFGNVVRSIDDLTWSETLNYKPENPWIDVKATYGRGHTQLDDLIKEGASSINPKGSNNGNLYDHYRYQSSIVDIANTATLINKKEFQVKLLAGYQFNENKREVTRVLDNTIKSNVLYPNGFNASAPPGNKTSQAVYVQPNIALGALSIIPGVRYDQYKIEAEGGTLQQLQKFNEPSEIEINKTSYSLGLTYDLMPKQLTLFTNYGQGFRPPLVDEYFTQGAFSRCLSVFMPHGPKSQICGDLYKVQTSESTEMGASYQNSRLFDTNAQLTSKLTYFHIHTSNLLSSLGETTEGEIVQRGLEKRNGIELETTLGYKVLYARLGYSHIFGDIAQDARIKSLRFNAFEDIPLYTAPGDALSLTLGAQITHQLEANISYRKVSERVVVLSGGNGTPLVFGTQDGYELFNAGAHWAYNRNFGLRLIGENLANKQYSLDGAFGGGIGTSAPGRNVRLIAEFTY
jgi:hemoglobin/transferrin/lactoferrin receptor protein